MMRFGRLHVPLLVAAAVLLLPAPGIGQGDPPPLEATLFFKPPVPPGLVFAPGAPIPMVMHIENASGAPIHTTANFSATDFFRRLYFIEPGGGIISNTGEAAIIKESRAVGFCQYRGGKPLPTALPVVPLEVLPTGFALEVELDARTLYDLSRPGPYSVNARIPLLTFDASDPDSVIADCDQFAGTSLVNVGAGASNRPHVVTSNTLEFSVGGPVTPPELVASCFPPSRSPGVSGRDTGLGLASIVHDSQTETYTILDRAGNRLVADFTVTAKEERIEFSVRHLQYGTSPEIVPLRNEVRCRWRFDRAGTLIALTQTMVIRGPRTDVEVIAELDPKTNETKIAAKRPVGRGSDHFRRPGLVILRMTTNQGQLGVEF